MAILGKLRDAVPGQVFVVEWFIDARADMVMVTDYTRTSMGYTSYLCVSMHRNPGLTEFKHENELCYSVDELELFGQEEEE